MRIFNNKKVCFILWYHYGRRFSVLSEYLQCRTLLVKHLIRSRGLLWKLFFWGDYSYKAIVTLLFLFYHRPEVVIASSPPTLCPIICWIYCTFLRKKLVVDAHNGAFREPWVSVPFHLKILKSATVVLVHNHEYKSYLEQLYPEIRFNTLNDRIPVLESSNRNKLSNEQKYFFVISSWSPDEPLNEILNAIQLYLDQNQNGIRFRITGNYNKNVELYQRYSRIKGIEFIGFIDDEGYLKGLKNAYGVIALTILPMVQQCAAMEAVGAAVPMIVPDFKTNRRLFSKGAVFTSIDALKIKESIEELCEKRSTLLDGIKEDKDHLIKEWEHDFTELNRIVELKRL